MNELEVVMTSASRPELLERTILSLLKNFKSNGKLKWSIHEDILNKKASDRCIEFLNSLNLDLDLKTNDPPIGQCRSVIGLLENTTQEFVVKWEDDYILLKEVDLSSIINVMEKYNINQVVFSKRGIMSDKHGFKKKTIDFNGIKLTACHHWYMQPAIWRMSFIRDILKKVKIECSPNFHWGINHHLERMFGGKINTDWVLNNTRTFYFGEIGKDQTIQHIGTGSNSLRMGEYKWK
jgi:hypothetical protein